ncbi:PaaI family thioesterase [Halocatena salina]|uniref:PaaI family thioesterase n=1 Tax=Halocatena salina TaxID=2934340 RepID=A0A8U0A2Z9_9EURY|nr:PaaI family thioesterase [Halocatena salina]UPM42383.1 PaaI family thioesterase [Halocatena salina]
MSEEFPDDVVAMVQQFIEQNHGYLSWLGVTVDEFTHDSMTLTIPFDEKLTNPTEPPTMHGGIAATLVDTAGGVALRPHLDNPLGGGVATINLNVNYLRRAAGDLTARAEVIRAGNSVGISRVTVESQTPDDETHPVAVGQGAYRLFQG